MWIPLRVIPFLLLGFLLSLLLFSPFPLPCFAFHISPSPRISPSHLGSSAAFAAPQRAWRDWFPLFVSSSPASFVSASSSWLSLSTRGLFPAPSSLRHRSQPSAPFRPWVPSRCALSSSSLSPSIASSPPPSDTPHSGCGAPAALPSRGESASSRLAGPVPAFASASSFSLHSSARGASLPPRSLFSSALWSARRTGVAVPPQIAAFGRTFVYAFLKPLRKDKAAAIAEAAEASEAAEAAQLSEPVRGESYFQDFDEVYDASEELRRLNELHKFYAVYTYPETYSFEADASPLEADSAPAENARETEDAGEGEREIGEGEEGVEKAREGASRGSSRLEPPPRPLPLPRRLRLPLSRLPSKALSLFPSPKPAASSPFVPSLASAGLTAPGAAPLPAPAFPSHALPPNVSAWGGFPLPASVSRDSARRFLAPSLLGDWMVEQTLGRQRAGLLSTFAFDSEANPAKPSGGVGVRTEDLRGVSVAGTLAAAAEAAPAQAGLSDPEAEARAVAARNCDVAESLLEGRAESDAPTAASEDELQIERRNARDRGNSQREADEEGGARLRFASALASAASGDARRAEASRRERPGEGFEPYVSLLDESARGGGIAMEMWLPGVAARDIIIELRLVGREEDGEDGGRLQTAAEGKATQSPENNTREAWSLDEEFVFRENIEHVEDRMFTKERKRWPLTILPMLVVNAPKSRRVLRWEMETFKTRQKHGRMADYERIQRAYRLRWPADIRRAEARLDSGRLMVVVPPLEDLSSFDAEADADALPMRIPVQQKPLPWTGLKGFRVYHSRRDWIFNFHKFSQYAKGVDLFTFDFKKEKVPIREPDRQEEQEAKRMAEVISKKNWRLWRGEKL
ncbi:hypothetical protein BESB_085510 [Besnoitia besnoiti]|uniref:SHSP domain-containing protein n=1 Tax=Besnoitia besnoiti TaxID=94643 RepID=A0A2A9MDA8_BESBE|nr:hypothetical protein BESB_085510 [Besnoitia besnoiti]PFH33352.1 hypothetical protein BESB_085510 [Besnoitia besnoiti]